MKKKVNLLLLMCFMFLIGAKAQVTLGKEQAINMVTITEGSHPHIQEYQLDYRINGEWKPLLDGNQTGRVKIHRFDTIYGDAVRVRIQKANGTIAIAELGIYQERR